jgi:hypothetical protein
VELRPDGRTVPDLFPSYGRAVGQTERGRLGRAPSSEGLQQQLAYNCATRPASRAGRP